MNVFNRSLNILLYLPIALGVDKTLFNPFRVFINYASSPGFLVPMNPGLWSVTPLAYFYTATRLNSKARGSRPLGTPGNK